MPIENLETGYTSVEMKSIETTVVENETPAKSKVHTTRVILLASVVFLLIILVCEILRHHTHKEPDTFANLTIVTPATNDPGFPPCAMWNFECP